jgi:hypothetical protein
VLRVLNRHFGALGYSLRSLFHNEQRAILGPLLAPALAETEATYQQLYERNAPLMRFLTDLNVPLPRGFQAGAEYALGAAVRRSLATPEPDLVRVGDLLAEARQAGVTLDQASVGLAFQQTVDRLTACLVETPESLAIIQQLIETLRLARSLPLELELLEPQNRFYALLQEIYLVQHARDQRWARHFAALGEALNVRVAPI